MIACVVIDGFAAGVERHVQPALNKQPLILVNFGAKRAKVIACSTEAAALGVEPGITLSRARGLCPNGKFIPADPARYERALDRLLELLWTFSNRVEVDAAAFPQSAVCYVDLGNLNAVDLERLTAEMHKALHLRASIGVAGGKLPARLAAFKGGARIVPHGDERAFIAQFPVDCLGFDKESRRRLELLGIKLIGQYADLPSSAILGQFGKAGRTLHALANGWDRRPVTPRKMPPVESAFRTFDDPLTSRLRLDIVVQKIAEELEMRLADRAAALHEMVLTVTFEDLSRHTERLHLLEPVATAKSIARVIGQLLDRITWHGGVMRIEVQLAHLMSAVPRQLELFTHKPARQQLIDMTGVLIERHGKAGFYEAELSEGDALVLEKRGTLRKWSVS